MRSSCVSFFPKAELRFRFFFFAPDIGIRIPDTGSCRPCVPVVLYRQKKTDGTGTVDEMGKQDMIDRIADMLGKADITMVRIVYHFAVSVLRKAKR